MALIEKLLQNMLNDLGCNETQFLLAARKGLKSKQNKKYFEQLIACSDFTYFKNMMVKKNLALDVQAYNLLHENMVKAGKTNLETIIKNDKDYQKLQELKQKHDLKADNEMDKIVSESHQRLIDLKEFEGIKNALDFSKKKDLVSSNVLNESAAHPADEEISLYSNNQES